MSRKNGQEEKRIQILEALDQCLQEKPFDQTSIKDIAKARCKTCRTTNRTPCSVNGVGRNFWIMKDVTFWDDFAVTPQNGKQYARDIFMPLDSAQFESATVAPIKVWSLGSTQTSPARMPPKNQEQQHMPKGQQQPTRLCTIWKITSTPINMHFDWPRAHARSQWQTL